MFRHFVSEIIKQNFNVDDCMKNKFYDGFKTVLSSDQWVQNVCKGKKNGYKTIIEKKKFGSSFFLHTCSFFFLLLICVIVSIINGEIKTKILKATNLRWIYCLNYCRSLFLHVSSMLILLSIIANVDTVWVQTHDQGPR